MLFPISPWCTVFWFIRTLLSIFPKEIETGKIGPLIIFLHTVKVAANISGKEEYLLYRKALKENILPRHEFNGLGLKIVLKAREDGLALLRANI
jgi:hypothetical protein